MTKRIFISYRRDDSAGHAGRVFDRLRTDFGQDVLFMDVDAIPLGANFVRVLREEVAKCDVLLAIMGQGWLGAMDEAGARRLDNPKDFVRIEIAAALARGIPVIPILLEGTRMPNAGGLPPDLSELSERNGLDVRHVSFHSDMDKLVRGLKALANTLIPLALSKPLTKKKAPRASPADLRMLDVEISKLTLEEPVTYLHGERVVHDKFGYGTIAEIDGIKLTIDFEKAGRKRIVASFVERALTENLTGLVPTVDYVIAEQGKWVEACYDAAGPGGHPKAPDNFDHFFISIGGCNEDLRGTILRGKIWNSRTVCTWKVEYGYCRDNIEIDEFPMCVTYLGPDWKPEFKALSKAVFKKLDGVPLERFITHP